MKSTSSSSRPRTARPGPAGEAVAGVRITHPDRVLDRESGLTKVGLARYYGAVAGRMLPYVIRRPLALVRCPEGDQAECFFQKQRTPGMPPSIHGSKIAEHGILHVEDEGGLIALIQFGAVELHGWGSRLPESGVPDWIVMDLDPDEGLPFARVVDAAWTMHDAFARIGLRSFVKTTGGKGLHVVVPIVPEAPFDAIKEFTFGVAGEFARSDPARYTATLSKSARRGKIFIDYLRNGQGATAIVPYAVRARPGAPVAFPVAWRDLGKMDPRDFSVATVPKLLSKRRTDPWADFFDLAQRVPPAYLQMAHARRRKSA
ncbi:non-homologous end-joining DNA ligase [Pendulispora albinea]|uniref:Non-homologous end-joining DNA ligase n=1 Tax=Pendulispora albinea TaxID=2741071 RepID=A0ABZ2LP91_9BACT